MAAHRADAQQRDLHMVDFGLTACAAVLKTGRLVLGPKNVHQPWPLALSMYVCLSVRPPLLTCVTDVTDVTIAEGGSA